MSFAFSGREEAEFFRSIGGRTLAARDSGRLWFDDNADDLLHFWDGTAWTGLLRTYSRASIQGTLSVAGNIIPPIIFPRACTVTKVSVRVGTAPTGASLQIDLEKNGGANSIFGTNDYVEITAGASANSSVDMDGTNSVLAADDYLEIDIDQVGSTIAGVDLTISIEVRLG